MTTKTCFKCGECKDLSEFYKHPQMKDGHVNKCKSCNKKENRENRSNKADYYREYDSNRNKTDKRKAAFNDKQKRKRLSKDYMKAHNAVKRAVASGKLIRPNVCSKCGKECKPDGHHDDHSKLLEVIWLCHVCHAQRHVELSILFLDKES